MSAHRRGAPAAGFVMLAVLIFIALFGAISAAVVSAGAALARRAAEEDLLFVGSQFRNAIRSYYESGAGGLRYPLSLEDLLRDKRFPGITRHLRRIYPDPLTGRDDWELMRSPEGGIMGVASKAPGTPLKTENFAPEFDQFRGKSRYADWGFTFVPTPAPAAASGAVASPAGGAPASTAVPPGAGIGGAAPAGAQAAGGGTTR